MTPAGSGGAGTIGAGVTGLGVTTAGNGTEIVVTVQPEVFRTGAGPTALTSNVNCAPAIKLSISVIVFVVVPVV